MQRENQIGEKLGKEKERIIYMVLFLMNMESIYILEMENVIFMMKI